ncbi:MAG: sortase, partial [Chloroflexota bacterium]|nr:sortase [Chloroflexota bacterium]
MYGRILFAILLLLALVAPSRPASAAPPVGEPLWFRETGHTLAYSFRAFWEQHGGLPVFGYPITEVFLEEGRPVQYFERARFEWHAPQAQVQAGHLGRWAAQGRESHP